MRENILINRKRKNRLRFSLWSLGFLFLGFLIITSIYLLLYSNFFKVKTIRVLDTDIFYQSKLLRELIPELLAQSKLKAILGPDNLFFWESQNLRGVKNLPALKKIDIQRNLFEKKVSISFEERKLLGIWCLPNSDCYGFDEDGMVFVKAPEPQGILILKINDENQRPIVVGGPILAEVWFKNMLSVLTILEENGWGAVEINLKSLAVEEWEVKILGDLNIYFSLNFVPNDLEAVVKNLSKRLNISKLTYLDFRVPGRVYYK